MQEPGGVMVWLTEKYPSLLERFSDGHSIYGSQETSCINRKGFIMFLSYGHHKSTLMKAYPATYCPPGSICGMLSIPRALPPVTHGSALQAPERMWRLIRGKEETSRGWGISVFVQLTQDFPGEQRNGGNNLPIGKTGKTFAASDLCTIFAPQKREDC